LNDETRNVSQELLELFPTIRLKMLTIFEKRLLVYNSEEDNLQEQDLHLTHNTTGDVVSQTKRMKPNDRV
jgi:hypothetical protein